MSDYSELKEAATRIVEVQTSQDVPISKLFDEFDALASPEAVLALIAEVEAQRKEIAALKPSPIRTDKTTIGYTGCVICGQYTDHGGLQCPNLACRSLSIELPAKPVPPSPIRMSIHGYPVDEDGKYIERKEVKP